MKTNDFAKHIVEFNKSAAKIGFNTISTFSNQAAELTNSLFDVLPNVPEEVKKNTDLLFEEQQKSLGYLQGFVDGQLNVDWTNQDALVKSIEVLEQFSKQAFSQADDIKKESKQLADKATEQMPKEAKPLVTIWNDAITNSFSLLQESLAKSLELSKELLAKEAVAPSAAKTKTSK